MHDKTKTFDVAFDDEDIISRTWCLMWSISLAFSPTLDFCFRDLLPFLSDPQCMQWKSSLSIPLSFSFFPPNVLHASFTLWEIGLAVLRWLSQSIVGISCCLLNFLQGFLFITPNMLFAKHTANNHPSLYLVVSLHLIFSPLGEWKWWSDWDHNHCWSVLGLLQRSSMQAHGLFVRCLWADIRWSSLPHHLLSAEKLNNLALFSESLKRAEWNSTCSSR